MKKRILSMLLALVMVLGMIPDLGLVAHAATAVDGGKCGDGTTWRLDSDGLLTIRGTGALTYAKIAEKPAAPVASVTTAGGVTTNYTDITSAIRAAMASEGSTLTLLNDITSRSSEYINSGRFTIDLNGKTWQCESYLMDIFDNADIKIIDSSTEKGGKLLGTYLSTIHLFGSAKLEIAGGTVENSGSNQAIEMALSGSPTSATLIVSGGKLKAADTAIVTYGASVAVIGGTFESERYDIYYAAGTIDLSDYSDSTGITIRIPSTFSGPYDINLPNGYVLRDESGNEVTKLVGGRTYTVGKLLDPEVRWGTSADDLPNSGTLDAAVSANAAYIQLQKDIEFTNMLFFQESVTIDLNGKTLSATSDQSDGVSVKGNLTLTDSSTAGNGSLSGTYTGTTAGYYGVDTDGSITVNGGTLSGTAFGKIGNGVFADGSITVNGGTLSGTAAGYYGVYAVQAIEVSGNGSLSGEGTGKNSNGVGTNSSITVTGGSLSGKATGRNGVYTGSSGITVTGGSLSGEATDGVGVAAFGSITVSGGSFSGKATGGNGYGVYAVDSSITVESDGKLTATGATALYIEDESGSSYKVESETEENGLTTKVLVAKLVTHPVYISAVDVADRAAIEGAALQILDTDDTVMEEWTSTTTVHTVTGLSTGEWYTLRAVVAPNGYTIPTDTTFSIHADGTLDKSGSTVTVENGVLLVEFAKTAVSISAVDADGKAIEGAHLEILDAEGNLVANWVSAADDEATTAVDESMHEATDLHTGEIYTIHTTVAPDGYTVPNDVSFSIGTDGYATSTGSVTENGALLVEFDLTEVMVSAVDAANGEALAGATMQILDMRDNLVEEWVSATDVHEIEGLKTGETYTLRAAAAPEGYAIPADITFTINADGTLITMGVVSEDGVLQIQFAEVKPEITSLTFNSDSPAYDAETNTFYIDEANPVMLTVNGRKLAGQKGILYFLNEGFLGAGYPITLEQDSGESFGFDVDLYRYCIALFHDNELTAEIVQFAVQLEGDNGFPESSIIQLNVVERTYEVELPTPEGGTVTTDKDNPVEGDQVTITVTPDEGKEVVDVVVTDENGDSVTVTDNGDGTYSYEQPAGNVTVEVTMKETEYDNEITKPEGGKVETDNPNPTMGDKVTITVDPDPGKRVDEVVVKDKDGNPIEVTRNPDGTYSYEQPSGEVTIEVTFENIPSDPTYRPTIEDSTGGDTTVSNKYPEKGDKVTITPKPDKGYEVGEITVTDSKGKPVKVTDNGDGTYTYVQPAGKVTITVTYVPEEAKFTDVHKGDYYYNAVNWAVAEGITNGIAATTFVPDMICTRAQAVTFLWRAAGSPEPKSTEMPFEDVSKDAYYYDAVLWAVENGITNGTSATTFSPNMECTRAQIVTFLWRSQGSPVASGTVGFTDVADDAYYAAAVRWAVENDVTNGMTATTFGPNAKCTRAQIVTFLYRAIVD